MRYLIITIGLLISSSAFAEDRTGMPLEFIQLQSQRDQQEQQIQNQAIIPQNIQPPQPSPQPTDGNGQPQSSAPYFR